MKKYDAQPYVMKFADGTPVKKMDLEVVDTYYFTNEWDAAAWMVKRGYVYQGHVYPPESITSWRRTEEDSAWLMLETYRCQPGWAVMLRHEESEKLDGGKA